MRIDIDSFRVLQVLVESGSYAKAAERLHKAQSAVSYQIKKLELHLGVQLLSRDQYRAELTEAGEVILAEGQRLLSHLGNIEQLAERFNEEWEPKLSLVIDGALPMTPILSALKRIAEHEIPTKIQLKMEFLGGVQYSFEKHQANIMLVKDFERKPNYRATSLPQIKNVLVVSSEHSLAELKKVNLMTLQQFVELTIEDSSLDSSKADDLQFGGEKVFYLSGFMMKKTALLEGLGFGWMPEFLIKKEVANGSLVTVDFVNDNIYHFTPHLVTTSERPLGKAGQLLTQLISNEFGHD